MRSTRVLVVAGLLLCASMGAFASTSSISEVFFATSFSQSALTSSSVAQASFHTYRSTAFDALRLPHQYPDVDANRSRRLGWRGDGDGVDGELVWAQVGNTSAADDFGVAFLKSCGKGLFGFQVAYDHWRLDDSTLDDFAPTVTTSGNWSKTDNVSVYAGYGWEATDTVSLGVGLEYSDWRDNFKSRTESTAFNGSQFEDVNERTDTNLIFGAKFHTSENFTWTAEARVGQSDVDSFARSDSLDTSGMVTSSSTTGFFDLDATRFGVGTNLNWYRDRLDYQITAYHEQVEWDLNNVSIDFFDMGGMVSSFNNVLSDDISETNTWIAGAAGWHEGPTHAYFQLGYYSNTFEVDGTGDFGNPGFDDYRETVDFEESGIEIGVSVLQQFTPKLAGIVGGAYVLYDLDEDATFRDINSMTFSTFQIGDSHGDSAMRVGLEYQAEHLILDFTFGETESDGLEAIDNEVFYASARFYF